MLLMIDNYDSFTFNLVQYFCELGEEVKVYRNDEITLDQIAALKPDRLVLSPGVEMQTAAIPGLGVAGGDQIVHAWKAGPQTQTLQRQLAAMPDGGTFAITGAIERMHRLLTKREGREPLLLMTGGAGWKVAPALDSPHELIEGLIFDGLLAIQAP